ncbi:hypothetical protein [Mycolicibacterium fortuitum]|uniref:Uncharacterized protein n=1 Tax=Mycobacterium phage Bipper TaxID=1805457 RepID=A0A142F2Q5_9CAUD|nr:hypothetical protein [Mycolicibacterium fortuitum]YP_009303274.1 hypothetical protein KCH39_gp050 [Mycobacterium phage Bipper]AMQ67062.1 hypothetical protein SEA_BIPPER_127 [Mycobacterium phage Bipper]UBV14820.1 hypothetical protein H8Z57_29685 [Mycolicibacterium fortuitum]
MRCPLTDDSRFTLVGSAVPPVIPPPPLQFPRPEPVAPWTALALAMLQVRLAELAPQNPFDPAAWMGSD